MKKLTPKTRIVKISYSDPDATDSSSDELNFNPTCKRSKKITHKIFIQGGKILENKKHHAFVPQIAPQNILNPSKKTIKNYYVGVRMRKSGRFGAEIRDPFLKKKLWLGTFTTPEEASRAYISKKREFEEKRKELRGSGRDLPHSNPFLENEPSDLYEEKVDSNDVTEVDVKDMVSGDEEAEFGYLNDAQVIDNYGRFVGEFSKIDDMSIPSTEDGVFLC
ncbi:hypothetical protein CDL12_04746 [Handroanthus impetiginosus]|uniref:AP2/ERF domain-containing protein n=1 Tax=Handroanthus impetiginosus TaxID=429701 RepID=A0A2G9HYJ9_9LAMI|nr:hypothetical protein CDL12_04746 [Handroanthus impetiginosus]